MNLGNYGSHFNNYFFKKMWTIYLKNINFTLYNKYSIPEIESINYP